MKRPYWPSRLRWPRKKKIVEIHLEPPTPEPKAKSLISFQIGKDGLSAQLDDVSKMRSYVSSVVCPICGLAKVTLIAYEKGTEGWEAAVTCDSCFVKGVFNDGGFRVVKPVTINVKE